MKKSKCDQKDNFDCNYFVHEFLDDNGRIRYTVADLEPVTGEYFCPTLPILYHLTGVPAIYLTYLQDLGSYPTRRQALWKARELYGQFKLLWEAQDRVYTYLKLKDEDHDDK